MTLPPTTKVDALFSEWDRPDSPGFAVAIIKDGEIVYKQGYGIANLEHDIPISSRSVFDIGSTSKQFTAACVALLARQGKLTLDDEIQEYISEMPRYEHPITIRHLIHHTSGIREYLTLMHLVGMRFENEYSDDEIIHLIARQKELNFTPGDAFLYSNSGYLLLAEIVKRVSGTSLRAFADEHIFTPLGMKATHFHDDFTMIVKDRATGYAPRDEESFQIDVSLFDVVGDGCIYTTVEDLYRWDQNFYHNTLAGQGQDFIEEIITPGALNSGESLDYAFGLFTGQYRGLKMLSHGGAWAGYRAEMLRFPEQHFSVICLSNLGSTNPTRLAKQIADIYLASEFTEQKKERKRSEVQFVTIPSTELTGKAGYYRSMETGIVCELFVQDGTLMMEALGILSSIAPTSSDHFVVVDIPFQVDIAFEKLSSDESFQMSVCIEGGETDVYQQLNAVSLSSEQLQDFVGAYHCEELDTTYHIIVEDGKLLLQRRNAPQETLKPITQELLKSTYVMFHFVRDEHNQITGFTLTEQRIKNLRFTKDLSM
ncbi:MAG: serine hydrolase domain-containing protein [Chloroflexota bacterium]